MAILTVNEVIELLVSRNILRRTKVYQTYETVNQGSLAFCFVENTDICSIKEPEFQEFVVLAIKNNEAEMTCKYQKEIDRKGPPDSCDYQSWENNVQYEVGTAKIRLSLRGGEPLLTISDITIERTYWSGY